jgi:hypothetical protein
VPTPEFSSFEDFWPHDLGEHSRRGTRILHFAGLAGAIALLASSAVLGPVAALLAPVFGYGLSWIGHFLVEKNRPATFRHPWWSLRGDFRMYRRMWLARPRRELERASPP